METAEPQSSALLRTQSGKACTNCARVKCKCIPRLDGTSCARCHRLNKTCVPSASAKRRGPKRGVTSRSARLEEKLDDLVSLLRAQQVPAGSDQGDNDGHDFVNDGFELEDNANSPSTSVASTAATGEDYSDEPSITEADDSLKRFREEMIIFTPYVYIPADMTSLQVRQIYPFLWINIMSVASRSVKTRNSLSDQARRIIVQRVVAGGERNLDLLFGILTFVNWVHLFPMDKHFASLASQLAVTLIWDLGLQMSPPEHPAKFPPDFHAANKQPQSARKERTIEERRAVLGAFVITSMVSHSFQAADGLRWSPYLDEYLTYVSRYSTVLQDSVLVGQVKMQLIVNQVRYASWKINNMEIPTAWVDILQSQLDNIASAINRASLPFGNSSIILGFYHFTTLFIHEWIMVKSPIPRNDPDLKRYEDFQRCVNSIKAWLDIFFSIPLQKYTSMPCSTYSQLCYVMAFLHQIITTRDAAWNSAAAQEGVDLLSTLDKIIYAFEQVKAVAPSRLPDSGEDQAFSLGIRKFQALKAACQSEIAPQDRAESAIQEAEMLDGSQGLFPTETMDYFGFHILPSMLDNTSW